MADYNYNYVAFLDILGFKRIILDSQNNNADKLLNMLSHADKSLSNAIFFTDKDNIPLEKVKKYIMSDSIVLYVDANIPKALEALIEQCSFIAHRLITLDEPILIRGGISRGAFYRAREAIAFGPGLVDAYLLQENAADTPRRIMLDEILDKIEKSELDRLTYIDKDRYRCVDYKKMIDKIKKEKIIQAMVDRLAGESDNRVRRKILYILDYFNS